MNIFGEVSTVDRTSVAIYEKPLPRHEMKDWYGRLDALRMNAEETVFTARQFTRESKQLRADTHYQAKQYKSLCDELLACRIAEVDQWRCILSEVLSIVRREIIELTEEKEMTNYMYMDAENPLQVVSECLQIRDERPYIELTNDMADEALKKEMCVIELNRRIFAEMSENAWKKIYNLKAVEHELILDINDKIKAIHVDKQVLNLTENSSSCNYKIDPLRIPCEAVSYEDWLFHCKEVLSMAKLEVNESLCLKADMFATRSYYQNMLNAQIDDTDFMLRIRIYETQRARNAYQWFKQILFEKKKVFANEISDLKVAVREKNLLLKLAVTRLESRTSRPAYECTIDEVYGGLKDEIRALIEMVETLECQLHRAKRNYIRIEEDLSSLIDDLKSKEDALNADVYALALRNCTLHPFKR